MSRLKTFFVPLLVVIALGVSFWYSEAWTHLAAGVALFLFGMQCLEEGLRQLAGSRLEKWLEHSTSTRLKAFSFGIGGTLILQSTTLMSMLTIAFISTGLIQLAGGISILLGINLGATGGMWLLAAAGQNVSLWPLTMPLLVFGILSGFHSARGKAFGRIIFGIAFIFMGIEQMKGGFAGLDTTLDFTGQIVDGYAGKLIFVAMGMLLTSMLMSSHATMMLILAAMGTGQLELWQGMSMAIGGNIGSSINVAIMGWLGGNPSGRRLALVHCLFNLVTGLVVFILLDVFFWLVQQLLPQAGSLLQLALFQTLFNLSGVAMFWFLQSWLERKLYRLIPEPAEPRILTSPVVQQAPVTRARYLSESALASADTASIAVVHELQHLGRLSIEVICHALYQPVSQLTAQRVDEASLLAAVQERSELDADLLYQMHIKGVYSDLLEFMSNLNVDMDEEHQRFWLNCQLVALQLVDAVKDVKHLQKNLGRYLRDDRSYVHNHYLDLRRHLLWVLRQVREIGQLEVPDDVWRSRLEWLDGQAAAFDAEFRQRIFAEVRKQQLNNLQASSLINDLGYTSRITQSLRNVLQLGLIEENELLRELRKLGGYSDSPLIEL